MAQRPLIGCATYRKQVEQTPPIQVYGLMPAYTAAIVAAGGLPVMIPLGLDEDALHAILQRLDGILLPGGGDVEPNRYGGNHAHRTLRDVDDVRDQAELLLVRHAIAQEKPLLAICRGVQIFNVALGGSLWEDVAEHMPGAIIHDYYHKHGRDFLAHEVRLQPNSRLAQILGPEDLAVNSLHHQGIRDLASAISAAATAPDGLVEGVEISGHPFAVGVQWHPENLLEVQPRMRHLFEGFIIASANGRH
jgi:putative glutamine amidotransferase